VTTRTSGSRRRRSTGRIRKETTYLFITSIKSESERESERERARRPQRHEQNKVVEISSIKSLSFHPPLPSLIFKRIIHPSSFLPSFFSFSFSCRGEETSKEEKNKDFNTEISKSPQVVWMAGDIVSVASEHLGPLPGHARVGTKPLAEPVDEFSGASLPSGNHPPGPSQRHPAIQIGNTHTRQSVCSAQGCTRPLCCSGGRATTKHKTNKQTNMKGKGGQGVQDGGNSD